LIDAGLYVDFAVHIEKTAGAQLVEQSAMEKGGGAGGEEREGAEVGVGVGVGEKSVHVEQTYYC